MKTLFRVLAIAVLLAGAGAGPVGAQSLATGTWSGKGVDPTGEEFPLTFEVRTQGDTLMIDVVGPDGGRIPLTNIRFEDSKLLFTFAPGPSISCELSPVEGGAYSGPCTDEDGGTGQITMTPPQS